MKNLIVHYSMSKPGAEAERSITLLIPPEQTDDILDGDRPEALDHLLDALARLQGYETADLLSVHAEVPPGVEDWDAGDEDWIPGEDNDV